MRAPSTAGSSRGIPAFNPYRTLGSGSVHLPMVEPAWLGQGRWLASRGSSWKMNGIRHGLLAVSLILASTLGPFSQRAEAATAAELNADGHAALSRLYAQSPKAAQFGQKAYAILVFPKIVKAGLVI